MNPLLFSAILSSLACASCWAQAKVEHEKFGKISFATDSVWTVGSQTWSDAVSATKCQKETFEGYEGWDSVNVYLADCRSNPNYKGDFFSWEAVSQYKDVLCPDDWRVPTKEDFTNLYKALSGDGDYCEDCKTLCDKYINSWGGTYSGYCHSDGMLGIQGAEVYYWSLSESSSDYDNCLHFYMYGLVFPQHYGHKSNGFSLRCVR